MLWAEETLATAEMDVIVGCLTRFHTRAGDGNEHTVIRLTGSPASMEIEANRRLERSA